MSDKKLIKVSMEFDDGTIRYLEGDDALKWQLVISQSVFVAGSHGVRTKCPAWKEKKSESPLK